MTSRGITNSNESSDSLEADAIESKSLAADQVSRLSKMQPTTSKALKPSNSEPSCTCDVGTETEPSLACCQESLDIKLLQAARASMRVEHIDSTDGRVKFMQSDSPEGQLSFQDDSEYIVSLNSGKLPTANFQRIVMSGEDMSSTLEDLCTASNQLKAALAMRARYMAYAGQSFPASVYKWLQRDSLDKQNVKDNEESELKPSAHPTTVYVEHKDPWHIDFPADLNYGIKAVDGVFIVYTDRECTEPLDYKYPSLKEYVCDMRTMCSMIADGPLKSFCYRRLSYLSFRFQVHVLLNEMLEVAAQQAVPHRDFYNIHKVDTHVHAPSCMNQKHLLRFIKKTMHNHPHETVVNSENKYMSLSEVFDSMQLTKYDLTVDKLDMHNNTQNFHRFDKYVSKYNPIGMSLLRKVFLQTDNDINGKYFAQIIKEVALEFEESKYQNAELRLPIFGNSYDEWQKLAQWAIKHNTYSPNIRWIIQTPRLYDIYKAHGLISSFQDFLNNIFKPVFEATNAPNKHPQLHRFLQHVVGFDSADNESNPEKSEFNEDIATPQNWTEAGNPSYSYYIYYMYANVTTLNHFRKARGLNTFTLRPHCGFTGMVDHLVVGYLLAENITHGLLLRKVPVLQYLYYLTQIGIAMSPLSNNSTILTYSRNPLPDFLARGLMVSLSTDEPLKLHYTKEPLMEEYSIAAQVWKFSTTDMAELARNSVLMSGFPHRLKLAWLGVNYLQEGVKGNDVKRTNVPNIRVAYRHETLMKELATIFDAADK